MKEDDKRAIAEILGPDAPPGLVVQLATYIENRTKNVNRVVVVDYSLENGESSVVYTKWPDYPVKVETQLQDEGRTLKVFIEKR